ncbi:hypothetical protein [Paucibacter sp. KCTC 42545]|uniref:hypothetical protein n=1 Tax=Paucibacter sp. KCTC 42545 TaxID=1768242 RepID=UPI000733BEBF|nr:hypothetical protein [Paucibacter sp. KCTC 42545]ALT78617.1 hypothetical protein AT984_16885 [Paucibacter sp. KCTC 42545]
MMRRRDALLGLSSLPMAAWAQPAPQIPELLWFIFLERGRPTPDDKAAVAAMQRGHIDNFKRLFGLGLLLAAGPLRDPSGLKRGIVLVRAASREQLQSYFEPDEYVREGYMTVNATPCGARRGLNTEGIDPNGIEESRIVLLGRRSQAAASSTTLADKLEALLKAELIGAWYRLSEGPIAEILFARSGNSDAVQAALAEDPGVADGSVSLAMWPQWLGKGVLR